MDDSGTGITTTITKSRSRIHLLSTLLPESKHPNPITSLPNSDHPALSLLSSSAAYIAISSSITTSPTSGAGDDPIYRWLYDTYTSSDHDPDNDLRLVVISFIPLIAGIYLSRIHRLSSPPSQVAGFEAVILAVYSSETNSRAGKPDLISIPDISQSSPYHTPRVNNNNQNPNSQSQITQPSIGMVYPPLEPQTKIKSNKRATIVGIALDCYYKQISQMPDWSKLDFCKFVADWAGLDCPCRFELDEKHETEGNSENVVGRGTRIALPWELLQPVLRILGHCLLAPLVGDDVKDAASIAVRCLYARSSHELVPKAILATRGLIQLDKRAREAAVMTADNTVGSKANTPAKDKKPEIHLV